MKKLLIFIVTIFFITHPVYAQQPQCDNRYVTLVNPVRGRDLWADKTINPLKKQYDLIKQYNFAATWLLQYDVLLDNELIEEFNKFENSQEKGVFLEVSSRFAQASRVIYPHGIPWYSPKAVFLSAYSQSERRRLINKLFSEFKLKFSYYPKSIGAWWIDSYSLNYMKNKYDIKSAMIVADQKTTDNYGVWGQWWGVPYYPAKVNILTPANDLKNKLDVVIIQWAQRDPKLAYGDGWLYSNFSLQANDYIRQGKDIKYFADLTSIYLDCKNPLGQITVGLETGIESVGYIGEYENQLNYLSKLGDINFVTMSQFADKFAQVFPKFPKQFIINSSWKLKTNSRSNSSLGDNIQYHQDIAFKDFFVADHQDFLDRNLQNLERNNENFFPLFLVFILIMGLIFYIKRLFNLWIFGTLFAVFSYGLILKSNYSLGWQVFYGSAVPNLVLYQILVILISYLGVWLFSKIVFIKNKNIFLSFLPLSFGLDFLIQSLRFSYFGDKYYFLFAVDKLRYIGLSFAKPFNLGFINEDFPNVIASSLLKINPDKILDNLLLSQVLYPLFHILLACILGYLYLKFPNRSKKILIGILIIFATFQLINIFQADPRLVQ